MKFGSATPITEFFRNEGTFTNNDKLALNLHLDAFLFLQLWFGVYYIAEEDSGYCASADSCESSNSTEHQTRVLITICY